jgi:hypothetical protein
MSTATGIDTMIADDGPNLVRDLFCGLLLEVLDSVGPVEEVQPSGATHH